MSAWFYAVAVSLALSVGAAALERPLRMRWRLGRLAWLAALVGSTALLVVGLTIGARSPGSSGAGAGGAVTNALRSGAASVAALAPDVSYAALWLATSAAMLVWLVGESWWVNRRARAWTPARLGRCRVLVSAVDGPAAFGLLRPRVVVPRWLMQLPPRARRLILLHEGEHHRGGDVRMQYAAAVLLALVPWNPVAWLQAARLRRAIELDCDARVVRRTRDPRAYGAVLIDVGERASGLRPILVVRLSWSKPFLERRLEALLSGDVGPRFAVAAAVAIAAVITALSTPAPAQQTRAAPSAVVRLTERPRATPAPVPDGKAPEADTNIVTAAERAAVETGRAAPAGVVRATGFSTVTPRPRAEPAETLRVRGTGGQYRFRPDPDHP